MTSGSSTSVHPLRRRGAVATVVGVTVLFAVALVAVAVTSDGAVRVVAAVASVAVVLAGVLAVRAARLDAIVIDGDVIARRSGVAGRLRDATDVSQVIEIDIERREYTPAGRTSLVLWAPRDGRVRMVGEWSSVSPGVRAKIAPYRKRGILPFLVPLSSLDDGGLRAVRDLLASAGHRESEAVIAPLGEGPTPWN